MGWRWIGTYSYSFDPVNERVEGHLGEKGEEWSPIPEEYWGDFGGLSR